eukprot:GHVP01043920.1.p1 GENE.GHVP01043920.1~~GHVP01043920.1.p1  ORF type:complete len:108 (-),score=17.98 GHVP01043920.1:517-840(-)
MNNHNSDAQVEFLLPTAEKASFIFGPKKTVIEVKDEIMNNWPAYWSLPAPKSTSRIRLLLRGRYLDDDAYLAYYLDAFEKTTIHLLIIREEDSHFSDEESTGWCCFC